MCVETAIAVLMFAAAAVSVVYLVGAPLWWAFVVRPMATRIRPRARA
jgi:hypothetical protein